MWRRRARSSPTLHNRSTDSYRWISKGDLYTREVRQPSATVGEHPDSTGLLSLSTPPESSYYTSCPTSASTVSRLRVFQVGSPMVRLASLLHCDTTRLRQAPEVRSAPCGPRHHPANPWSLSALVPKHGKARRRRDGRSLGIGLLLPYCCQSPHHEHRVHSVFAAFAGKKKSRGAESNRLSLLQLRVCLRVF